MPLGRVPRAKGGETVMRRSTLPAFEPSATTRVKFLRCANRKYSMAFYIRPAIHWRNHWRNLFAFRLSVGRSGRI